jgi:hypothetical protein
MTKEKQIGKIEQGKVYEISAPLDEQISAFEKVGITYPYLATPEQVCNIRLQGISDDWTRTSIAPVAVKGENTILYRNSPFMNPEIAKIAVEVHRNSKYPELQIEFYEAVKQRAKNEQVLQPEDRIAHILEKTGDYDLTSEMDDTKFILGKPAKRYFDKKVEKDKIKLFNLQTDNLSKNKCRVNYLWFHSVASGSELNLRDSYLNCDGRAFGVLQPAKQAQKISRLTLSEIQKAIETSIPKICQEIGISALEEMLNKPIQEEILTTLRKQ